MGVAIEDVVAIKVLETGIVPPVPTSARPTPSSAAESVHGRAAPRGYALRLAAGFGSQVAWPLLRWIPTADGLRRRRNS